ncbi:hypothetical protein AURDEDRAFT_119988 [Auricularia subglabra TFB-10046 SS5]|nr:hypothetical protein AURDEDRAFT_119988 [Auricularia subglabra TFB-10046 SS5]
MNQSESSASINPKRTVDAFGEEYENEGDEDDFVLARRCKKTKPWQASTAQQPTLALAEPIGKAMLLVPVGKEKTTPRKSHAIPLSTLITTLPPPELDREPVSEPEREAETVFVHDDDIEALQVEL